MTSKKSILLGIVGKTLKKGPPKIKPKAPPKIKSKGPYTRAIKPSKALGIPGPKTFQARRDIFRGVQKKPSWKAPLPGAVVGGAAGYAIAKYGTKGKKAKAKDKPSHQDIARKGAKELIKKQKEKKGKRKSPH